MYVFACVCVCDSAPYMRLFLHTTSSHMTKFSVSGVCVFALKGDIFFNSALLLLPYAKCIVYMVISG